MQLMLSANSYMFRYQGANLREFNNDKSLICDKSVTTQNLAFLSYC